jgi:uncharacterized membrane protein YqgA involved in biofilm formation
MIATVINALAVLAGSLVGMLFHSHIKESFRTVVSIGAGVMTVILGVRMSMDSSKIVFLALSLILGGILGEWWKIEDGILALGNSLKRTFAKRESGKDFAYAFLTASVLFCVGAMSIVGAFKAGTEGNYELLFTKSVMDGFMAIVLTAALGIGVAFSAATVLVYQGALTMAAVWIKPLVSEVLLKELTGVGGALLVMIGINLLGLAKVKTANFIPSLLLIVAFVALEGLVKLNPI